MSDFSAKTFSNLNYPPRMEQTGYALGQNVRCLCDIGGDCRQRDGVVKGAGRDHGQAVLIVEVEGKLIESPFEYVEAA